LNLQHLNDLKWNNINIVPFFFINKYNMEYFNMHNKLPMFEGYCRRDQIDGKHLTVYISGRPVKVKVAANDSTKQLGFMHQDEPSNDSGILFVYDVEDILRFWMKNVKFSLDILFFDSKMQLVDHFTMDPYNGESDKDLKIYKSSKPAQYAVELKAGWADMNLKGSDSTLKF
jgi:uncharacterized membrane protein (UPF0127 family)